MKTSVVVTTYSWPQALGLVLAGLARQSLHPDEVIVADDGSSGSTPELLKRIAPKFPVPLRHFWQEDAGFRAARARNAAIAVAQGDYVLLLDGDMVPHRDFVADHLLYARPGTFVQGSRVLTTAALVGNMLDGELMDLSLFTPGLERRRNVVHSRLLAQLHLRFSASRRLRGIKTCNQGWYRRDLLRLNGFDERMVGWGREDTELAWRAWHAGIKPRHLRFAGLAWHLYHPKRHVGGASSNDAYLRETPQTKRTWAECGIDQHLDGERLPDLRATGSEPDLSIIRRSGTQRRCRSMP